MLRAIWWKGVGPNTHGAKLDWKSVCTPREEGGLGFRLLTDRNKAVMMRHLWALCSKEDILWVTWVYMYIIKSQCLWQMPIPQDASVSFEEDFATETFVPTFGQVCGGYISLVRPWHPLAHCISILVKGWFIIWAGPSMQECLLLFMREGGTGLD